MATVICDGTRFTNVQAVFLDKDGTLANVANYLSRLGQLQAQYLECRVPGSYHLLLDVLGVTSEGLSASGLLAVGTRQETIWGSATVLMLAGISSWIQAVDLATAALAEADRQCAPKAKYTPLIPGVLDFLQRLRQARIKIIMVSADAQGNLEEFVQFYQLQTYFDQLQGVRRHYPSKTSPDFLQAACQAIDILPDQGLVIGDAATDLQIAHMTQGFIGFLGGWSPSLSKTAILNGQTYKTGQSSDSHDLVCSFATTFSEISIS